MVGAVQRSSSESKSGVSGGIETDWDAEVVVPEPVWESKAEGVAEVAPTWRAEPQTKPRPIPSWQPDPPLKTESEMLWGRRRETAPKSRSAVARTRRRAGRRSRKRVIIATVVLACLLVVFVAVAVIVYSLHSPSNSTEGRLASANHGTSTTAGNSSSGVSAFRTATDVATFATTTTRAKLQPLPVFPTPKTVAAVVEPYLALLQRYEAFLSSNRAPATIRTAAANAEAQVSGDLTFFNTLHGLPSPQLGAYLDRFLTDSSQLQRTLTALNQELRRATP